MRVLITGTPEYKAAAAREPTRLWVYNGLDSCITHEVFAAIEPQLWARPTQPPQLTSPQMKSAGEGVQDREEIEGAVGAENPHARTYRFSRSLQAPLLEMMLRGVRVDKWRTGEAITVFEEMRAKLDGILRRLLTEGLEMPASEAADFNPQSHQQLLKLFYETLGLHPILSHQRRPTVDRDALEKLARYPQARPFTKVLVGDGSTDPPQLGLRDINKTLQVLRTAIDADGRMRTSFNIAGTNTGRLSSYVSANGTGGNTQNLDPQLRKIFSADPGMRMAYVDLEQAESRAVGAIVWNLFGDGAYLDACEAGDLHTQVAKMVWPAAVKNREDADRNYYRNFTYRFLCKRIGHGSNYFAKPQTISSEAKIDLAIAEEFQTLYFKAFAGIRRWQHKVAQQIAEDGFLVSLMGRKRWVLGRRDDDATLREMIAFDPQSAVADILNIGLFNVWWRATKHPREFPVQLLLQVHDAILLQYPAEAEDSLIPQILSLLQIEVPLKFGRKLVIPAEAKVGWNWGEEGAGNRDGLRKWKPGKPDPRIRESDPSVPLVDRLLHGLHREPPKPQNLQALVGNRVSVGGR